MGFRYERLYDLFAFLKREELLPPVARLMLPGVVSSAEPDFNKLLEATGYSKASMAEIRAEVKELGKKFAEISYNGNIAASVNWVMGQIYKKAIGTVRLAEVRKEVSEILEVR